MRIHSGSRSPWAAVSSSHIAQISSTVSVAAVFGSTMAAYAEAYLGKDAVAPGDGTLDDVAVVRRSGNDSDAPLEGIELLHAALAAHANHGVAPIECVLHHVLPEFPGSPDDTDLRHVRQAYSWVTALGDQ